MSASYDSFEALEREGWQRVADKYENAWSGLTRLFIPALLEVASVKPGNRLLDVACGPGYVADAARSCGARVIGIDFCEPMIRTARQRYPKIEFRQGDAQALGFADRSFDIVAMNFGLLHLPRPEAAIREARRVLRPGGRFAFTVWAGPEQSPGARIVDDAIKANASTSASFPSGPEYFAYGSADQCREVLQKADFDPASFEFRTVMSDWQIPTASFLFEAERDAGVRTAAVLAVQSPDALVAIERDIARSLGRYANDSGFAIPFAAHVIGATCPG
jgi:ubiquinone/menaquinone biosynthesis C-methylase UbiE